jgi:hypothetical protein
MTVLRRLSTPTSLGLLLVGLICPGPARSQIRWQDLVLTGGLSGESYRGNLAPVTISAVDSTEQASATVGEFGLRGGLIFLNQQERSLDLQVDAGLRQFSAWGFKVRDYAPREWVGRADLSYRETLSSLGELWVQGGLAGRRVEDRPPMPLFIQPGYTTVDGRVRLQLLPIRGAYVDAQLLGEVADYSPTALAPQLDLLNRRMLGVETGVTWGPEGKLRAYLGFSLSAYENQATFDPGDPHRRDRTMSVGATWTTRSRYFAQLGVEGTVNRSNSSRPEYDALSVRAVVSAPLRHDLSLTFFADLTDKRYVTETDFARLVPGEEADNASVIYLELARPLMVNLDGALRLGWNRAETDIGDSYFERYGVTVLLRYRPRER